MNHLFNQQFMNQNLNTETESDIEEVNQYQNMMMFKRR